MSIIISLFIIGIVLIFFSKFLKHQQGVLEEARQEALSNYDQARQKALDDYRKAAEEKYTKLGLAELLPHMIVEVSKEDGEIQLRWVGLSSKQEQLLMKTVYEDEESYLVDRVGDDGQPVEEESAEIDVSDYVKKLTADLVAKNKSCATFLLPYAAAYVLSEMPQMTAKEYTESFGVDISQSAYQKYMGPLFKNDMENSQLTEIDLEYYKKKIGRHFNL